MAITAAFWSRRSECGIDQPLSGAAAAAACYGALMKISGRAEYKPVGDSLACHCNFNGRRGCEHSQCSCFFNVESLKATFLSLFGNCFLVRCPFAGRQVSEQSVQNVSGISAEFSCLFIREKKVKCANRKATALLCNSETKTAGSGRGSGLRRRKRILTDALVYIKPACWKTSAFFGSFVAVFFFTEIGLFQSPSRNSRQAACFCYKCRKKNARFKITLSEFFETRKWTLSAKKHRSIGYTRSWRTDTREEIPMKGWKEASKFLKSPR